MTPIVTSESADIGSFFRDVLRFPLWPGQETLIREWEAGRPRLGIWRLGRRSGKSRMAAGLAVWSATANSQRHLDSAPRGEQLSIVCVSRSQRLARVTHRMIRGFLQSPALAHLVVAESADSITLSNGLELVTVPCHAAATRGMAVPVALLDEAPYWQGADGSMLDAAEVFEGIEPSTAQFEQGFILAMGTPRLASGWFFDQSERARSGRFPGIREWHRETSSMNPQISRAWLASKEAEDPLAFSREYRAVFEASISSALDAALVRAAVRDGPESLPPLPGRNYLIALDPAFSSGGETFACVVGHREPEPDNRVIVDLVKGWKGAKGDPVRVDAVLDEIAALSLAFHGAPVTTDQFAAVPLTQSMAMRGLTAQSSAWTSESKVAALAAVRRCLYAGRLEIPNNSRLISEMVNLESRAGPSGRPKIAAPGGQHDDFCSALMALVAELATDTPPPAGVTIEPSSSAGYDALIALHAHPDRPVGFGLGSRRQRGISRILSR
jgi:hypothetical protein